MAPGGEKFTNAVVIVDQILAEMGIQLDVQRNRGACDGDDDCPHLDGRFAGHGYIDGIQRED